MLCLGRRCASISLRWIPCQRLAVRTITKHPQTYANTEEYWRAHDGLPRKWELIYKGPIDKVIGAFATFVTVSSFIVGGLGVQYYLTGNDPNAPVLLAGSDVVLAEDVYEFLIFVVAYIVLHITIKIFISRFVIRMYKNNDKYLAVYRGNLYHQIKKHEFDVKDFKRLKMTTFVSWGDSRFALGSRKGILLADYFKTPRHLNAMLVKGDTEEYNE